jgi:hypothetical protein
MEKNISCDKHRCVRYKFCNINSLLNNRKKIELMKTENDMKPRKHRFMLHQGPSSSHTRGSIGPDRTRHLPRVPTRMTSYLTHVISGEELDCNPRWGRGLQHSGLARSIFVKESK